MRGKGKGSPSPKYLENLVREMDEENFFSFYDNVNNKGKNPERDIKRST